jgi:hypothetical protein
MQGLIRSSVLLVGACLIASIGAGAQAPRSQLRNSWVSSDLAFTYSAERAQVTPGRCCFWLQGAGVDLSINFGKGFSLVTSVSGETASEVSPGVDVNKITYLTGPRYTFAAWKGAEGGRRLQIFGQGLFGGVRGFGGVYPAAGAPSTSAGSFAMEAGGGLNLFFTKKVGLRLAEAEYVRTALPNNGTNTQHDLRLLSGLMFHF